MLGFIFLPNSKKTTSPQSNPSGVPKAETYPAPKPSIPPTKEVSISNSQLNPKDLTIEFSTSGSIVRFANRTSKIIEITGDGPSSFVVAKINPGKTEQSLPLMKEGTYTYSVKGTSLTGTIKVTKTK